METPAIKQNHQKADVNLDLKRHAWGEMGIVVYKKELEFQVQAQASLSKLENPPAAIEEIPAAEMALKEVKADQAKLMDERKKITAQFDAVTQRLMDPEKSFAVPVADFSNAIIKVTKEHEKKEAEKKLKGDEINSIRQQVSTEAANWDAKFKNITLDKVGIAYEFALNKGIEFIKIDEYLSKVSNQITESTFKPIISSPVIKYCTPEELEEIIDELFIIYPFKYVQLFQEELKKRFSDYEVAFSNKLQAIELAKQEQQRKGQEILEQQQNKAAAAQLEAIAIVHSIEPAGIKALKKCYEVDMEETYDNAMKILAAFLANKTACQPKTSTKKWFSFSADSAAKALAKVKSDDNNFSPAGIIWKEVDKL